MPRALTRRADLLRRPRRLDHARTASARPASSATSRADGATARLAVHAKLVVRRPARSTRRRCSCGRAALAARAARRQPSHAPQRQGRRDFDEDVTRLGGRRTRRSRCASSRTRASACSPRSTCRRASSAMTCPHRRGARRADGATTTTWCVAGMLCEDTHDRPRADDERPARRRSTSSPSFDTRTSSAARAAVRAAVRGGREADPAAVRRRAATHCADDVAPDPRAARSRRAAMEVVTVHMMGTARWAPTAPARSPTLRPRPRRRPPDGRRRRRCSRRRSA